MPVVNVRAKCFNVRVTQIAFEVLICDVSLVLRIKEFLFINVIKRLAFEFV